MALTDDNRVALVPDGRPERLVRLLDSDDLELLGHPGVPGYRAWTRRAVTARRGRPTDGTAVAALVVVLALQPVDLGHSGVVGEEEALHLVAGEQTRQLLRGGYRLARGARGARCCRLRPLFQDLDDLRVTGWR